jgi:hypothetical protein
MSIRACASTPTLTRAFLVGAALLLGFSLGNPASAASVHDYIDVDPVFQLATPDNPVTGTLDITTNDGDCYLGYCDTGVFDPDTGHVSQATIGFLLFDVELGNDDVAIINLGDGSDPFQQDTVDGSDRFFLVLYLEKIQAEVDVMAQINATGTIDWQVATAAGNDSVLVKAGVLMADEAGVVIAGENAIPEPSAALLFCLGFGVVGTATRTRRTF